MNRQIRCIDCDVPKWTTQKSWRKLLDLHGTRTKIHHRFRCRSCRKLEKDDPFKYQIFYGKPIKELRKRLKGVYLEYYKEHDNTEKLQEDIKKLVIEYYIDHNNLRYHIDGKRLLGITITDFLIFGKDYEIYIPLFTPKEFNRKWELQHEGKI